jgi:hypothetical protein
MHVGSVGSAWGSWGTSRLWHDPNYEVSKDLRTVPVQKGIEAEEALPKEEHVAPPQKKQDPFTVQEQAYDVAASQMARGVEGQKLLHGQKSNPLAFDAAVAEARQRTVQEDVTRTTVTAQQAANPAGPAANVRPQEVVPAAPGSVPTPAGSSQTAADRENQQAAKDAKDVSSVVDAMAVGVGGVIAAASASAKAVSGVVGASQAAAAISAGGSVATTGAASTNLAMHDDDGPLAGVGQRQQDKDRA